MTSDLLINILIIFGGVVSVAYALLYAFHPELRDAEGDAEEVKNWKELIQNPLDEDAQFILVILPAIGFPFIMQFVSLTAAVFYVAGYLTMAVGTKMTNGDGEDVPEPVPDTDPRHIDPAGGLADAVESGNLDLSLDDDQDAEDLRVFVDAAERGVLGPVDPGLEAQVRIARALLGEDGEDGEIDRDAWRARLADTLAGSGDLADRRADEILKMYDYLREHGEATNDELRATVDPDAVGYKDAESVWANMVKGKDTLRELPGVEKPATGRNDSWRYTGEGDA